MESDGIMDAGTAWKRRLIRTDDVYQTNSDDGVSGYSETLVEIVASGAHAGIPEGCNARSMVGKSKREEVAVRLHARIDPETRIVECAGYQVRGNLGMAACASCACALIEGRTVEEAAALSPDEIAEAVGGLPVGRGDTAVFAAEAVRALVGDWLIRGGADRAELDRVVPCDPYSPACLMCEHCSLRDSRVDFVLGCAGTESPTPAAAMVGAAASATASGAKTPGALDFDEAQGACADSEEEAQRRRIAEHNALARVFDDVRAQSRDGVLSCPTQWEERGLVPPSMTSEEFEMFVYEYWEEHGFDQAAVGEKDAEAAPAKRGETARQRKRVASSAVPSSAIRSVGVPPFLRASSSRGSALSPTADQGGFPPAAAKAAPPQETSLGRRGDAEGVGEGSRGTEPGASLSGLDIPDGYKLVEIEGELTVVPLEEGEMPRELPIDCETVDALVGRTTYYLYDRSIMTDAFAHWAFLAAEADDVVTFVDCVREESRVYPRPMPIETLENDPFGFTDERVFAAWDETRLSGDYPDIEEIIASNGDIFYFSTRHLTREYAESLAEWAAVERLRNV